MQRLLQGEVGSGKTLVALRAMLAVVDAGGQAALLAPTEVLAAQHFQTVTRLLGDLADGGTLGGGRERHRGGADHRLPVDRPASRGDACARHRGRRGSSSAPMRCSSAGVQFADLGLVVVDEQHRFGVEQRAALERQGRRPGRTCW